MHAYLLEMLQCPACCHGILNWHVSEQDGDRIQTTEARRRACATAYPVEEGIALFLTPDLPRRDLWEESESNLARQLRDHPSLKAHCGLGLALALLPLLGMALTNRIALCSCSPLWRTIHLSLLPAVPPNDFDVLLARGHSAVGSAASPLVSATGRHYLSVGHCRLGREQSHVPQ